MSLYIDPYLTPYRNPLAESLYVTNSLTAIRALSEPSARQENPVITHKVLAITPDMAYEYLTRNTSNRHIRQEHVDALARDMKAGRWQVTGAPIVFDHNGVLLDGQHRLCAVIEADTVIVMMVVTGVDPEAQDVIDTGIKRTVGDALTIEGKVQHRPAEVAAIARAVLLLDNHANGLGQRRPTQAEVLDMARTHSDRFQEAAYVSGRAKTAGLRGGILYGLAYYYLSAIDADDAERFFDKLITGADVHPGQPVYALRQKLIKDAPRPSRQAQDIKWSLGYFYKTWNAYRRNKPMITLRRGANEDYPVPI